MNKLAKTIYEWHGRQYNRQHGRIDVGGQDGTERDVRQGFAVY